MAVYGGQDVGAAEGSLDRTASQVGGVDGERVVVYQRVVPRWARTVVAVVGALHGGVTGEPIGVVVDTGARTIYVVGLDANWVLTNDTITMNGTTAVNFNVDMLRVLSATVLTAGTTGTNEGEITIFGADGTSKIMAIAAGEGISHSASYSVPAGVTFYIVDQFISDASLKGANLSLIHI